MERSSKRGKIPQQDWPSIIARYEQGETLASIARTYDCSPPAISYILSRSRARATATSVSATAVENSGSLQGENSPSHTLHPSAPAMPRGTIRGTARVPEQGNGAAPRQGPPAAANPLTSGPPGNAAGNGAQNGPVPRDPTAPMRASARLAGEGAPRDGTPHAIVTRGPQEEGRRTLHLPHGPANGPERNGAVRNSPEGNGESSSSHGPDAPPVARPAAAQPPFHQPAHPPASTPGHGAPTRTVTEPQQKEGGSIGRCANGCIPISRPSSPPSMPPWRTIPPKAAPPCARRRIACCAPAPARALSSNGSRRGCRCRHATNPR
jgi:hypothetical protein